MIANSTRIVDIKPENKIKSVTKTEDGSLLVEQNFGSTFSVSKDDPIFQEFLIYTVLYEL